ncbi:unnamed protein product [Chrysoparadoxa australica]
MQGHQWENARQDALHALRNQAAAVRFWLALALGAVALLFLCLPLVICCILSHAFEWGSKKAYDDMALETAERQLIKEHIKDDTHLQDRWLQLKVHCCTEGKKMTIVEVDAHLLHAPALPSEDKPPLLLIHGTSASAVSFISAIKELRHNFDVYAIDMPGFGRTSTSTCHPFPVDSMTTEATISFYTEYLEACCCALGLERVSVLGHSYGAFLSIHFAAAHPERISHLLLASAAGVFPTLGTLGVYWACFFKSCIANVNQSTGRLGRWFFFTMFRLMGLPAEAYYRYDLLASPSSWGCRLLAQFITLRYDSAFWNSPALEALANLDCPVRTLYGELDCIMPSHQGDALTKVLGIKSSRVPGAGHLVLQHPHGKRLAEEMEALCKADEHEKKKSAKKVVALDPAMYASSFSRSLTSKVIHSVYNELLVMRPASAF